MSKLFYPLLLLVADRNHHHKKTPFFSLSSFIWPIFICDAWDEASSSFFSSLSSLMTQQLLRPYGSRAARSFPFSPPSHMLPRSPLIYKLEGADRNGESPRPRGEEGIRVLLGKNGRILAPGIQKRWPKETGHQCDQKIFFQIANWRCQNRQKVATIFRKLFEIAIILGQNRHLNPDFFVFYCIFINKIFPQAKNDFCFFEKVFFSRVLANHTQLRFCLWRVWQKKHNVKNERKKRKVTVTRKWKKANQKLVQKVSII